MCLCGLKAEIRFTGVDALIEAGHWKRARQIAAARVQANPADAQAHAWLSKIASGFADLEASIREAEKAVQLDESNAAFHGQLAESCALMADKAHVLKSFPYVRRMRKEIDATLALDPRQVDTLLVDMLFSWKAPGIAGGDKQKARRIADQIVKISPAWGYLGWARLLQLQGDSAATEQALKKAVAAEPSFYRARVSLAVFFCDERNCPAPADAERYALEAIAVDPGAAAAYEVLARSYVAQQRWADLDRVLSRAENAVPDDLGPYFAAASRLAASGRDFDRAGVYLKRYLAQAPEGRQPTLAEARGLLNDVSRRAGRRSLDSNLKPVANITP